MLACPSLSLAARARNVLAERHILQSFSHLLAAAGTLLNQRLHALAYDSPSRVHGAVASFQLNLFLGPFANCTRQDRNKCCEFYRRLAGLLAMMRRHTKPLPC